MRCHCVSFRFTALYIFLWLYTSEFSLSPRIPVLFPLLQHRLKSTSDIMSFVLSLSVACLILFAAHPIRGYSNGAQDDSCDSLTVLHTHLGTNVTGTPCGQHPCRSHQLRLIGSSVDTFVYNCGQTYQCELKPVCMIARE